MLDVNISNQIRLPSLSTLAARRLVEFYFESIKWYLNGLWRSREMTLVRNAQLWKCNPSLHQWWEGNRCWTLIFHFPLCKCLQQAWLHGVLSYRIKVRPDENLAVSLPSLIRLPDLYSLCKQALKILGQKPQKLHHLQNHWKIRFVGFFPIFQSSPS